jgi:transcriptional regulator with XRE-family HTH domain
MFVFTKEMAVYLQKLRKQANLTQTEVAKIMGIKAKSGQSFIAQLENGLIKNPTITTLFDYLTACGASWTKFVSEIESGYKKSNREKLMSQVKLPGNAKLQNKISRDTALYETKIQGVPKGLQTLDIDRVKHKIKHQVELLLAGHHTEQKLVLIYLDFAWHMLDRELNPNPNSPLDKKPWIRSGINSAIFTPITQIVHKAVWYEKKRLIKQKPLSEEKRAKMTVRFSNFRSKIEPIETAVHALLCQVVIPEVHFPLYKAYTRECYRAINKYFAKEPEKFKQKMSEINNIWIKRGLKPEALEKITSTVFAAFKS